MVYLWLMVNIYIYISLQVFKCRFSARDFLNPNLPNPSPIWAPLANSPALVQPPEPVSAPLDQMCTPQVGDPDCQVDIDFAPLHPSMA